MWILWEYRVQAQREEEFEKIYGPDGDWPQLFRRGPGYLGTELLADATEVGRYVTLDRWETEADRLAFLEKFRAEYEALDERCQELTTEERLIGIFLAL